MTILGDMEGFVLRTARKEHAKEVANVYLEAFRNEPRRRQVFARDPGLIGFQAYLRRFSDRLACVEPWSHSMVLVEKDSGYVQTVCLERWVKKLTLPSAVVGFCDWEYPASGAERNPFIETLPKADVRTQPAPETLNTALLDNFMDRRRAAVAK